MHRLRLRVSASDPSHFPPDKEVHEIAAFGRSNVGKSSLINALADSTIVKASDKPGETQQVSWYDLGSKMALVDLPGYGFAYADEEKIANWKAVVRNDTYLIVLHISSPRVFGCATDKGVFK
jgi:GTP-binding protein EngB required for normal cell division